MVKKTSTMLEVDFWYIAGLYFSWYSMVFPLYFSFSLMFSMDFLNSDLKIAVAD